MSILEEAMKDQTTLADDAFINNALSELEEDIAYIESQNNKILIGDRADFDRARNDWKRLTKIQVAYAVSAWRKGIWERYSKK